MIKRGKKLFIKSLYILIDIFFMGICIYMIALVRSSTFPFDITWQHLFFDAINPYRYVLLFWMLVAVIINNSYDLYQTKREIVESAEIWDVIKSVVLSALITIVAIYVIRVEHFPRSVLALITVSWIVSFSLWRICKRFFVQYLVARGYNNFNAVVIGAGKIGTALAQELAAKPHLGVKVVGFLDDYRMSAELEEKGLPPVLGDIESFADIARREFIHKVFITVHHDSKVFLQILEEAKEQGVSIQVVPQGFKLMPSEFHKYSIGFIPVLEYSPFREARQQFGKRLFDFILSFLALVALLPLFAALMVAVKSDGGPVFYHSRRYGRRGRVFHMFKFRSMTPDADLQQAELMEQNEADGPIFKIRNDPRITPVGRFLRRYSLDELPQLLNVLKGDMSLVGPRPLPIEQIEREDWNQLKRLEVRPGITGLWQIRGRSDASFTRLVRWDMWYITNWSLWLDINILVQTIPVVVKGKGAY